MADVERRATVITVSTRAAGGVYDDEAGPRLVEVLAAAGFTVSPVVVVPDGRQGPRSRSFSSDA
jgi:molybdopterin biosynthesis enzyme MoaB